MKLDYKREGGGNESKLVGEEESKRQVGVVRLFYGVIQCNPEVAKVNHIFRGFVRTNKRATLKNSDWACDFKNFLRDSYCSSVLGVASVVENVHMKVQGKLRAMDCLDQTQGQQLLW